MSFSLVCHYRSNKLRLNIMFKRRLQDEYLGLELQITWFHPCSFHSTVSEGGANPSGLVEMSGWQQKAVEKKCRMGLADTCLIISCMHA